MVLELGGGVTGGDDGGGGDVLGIFMFGSFLLIALFAATLAAGVSCPCFLLLAS
jgi:hypothetical protein